MTTLTTAYQETPPAQQTEAIVPTRAYDLLDTHEKQMVDDYVRYAVNEQRRKRERIYFALFIPIAYEYLKRSRDALYKPLLRAAVAERIREEAHNEDISPTRVIKEHAAIAFSNMEDYVEANSFGELRVKNVNDIGRDKMQAVKSIETRPGAFGLHTKIVLHDKHPSLKAMGEMMGLVAPDQPPALEGYVSPERKDKKGTELAPEQTYTALLQTIGG